jgi:hypothetical protein
MNWRLYKNISARTNVILRIIVQKIIRHAFDKIDPAVATYLPESEYGKVFFRARAYLLFYDAVIALAFYQLLFLPLMFIGFPLH